MSESRAGAGLRLLRERAAGIPDALRRMASDPPPLLQIPAGGGVVITGVGSSLAHARYLARLLAVAAGVGTRVASPGEFVDPKPGAIRHETLVVFSQGLSPNARFALAQARAFEHAVLVTSTPTDGGTRGDAAEKRALLQQFEAHGGAVMRIPGADEFGTLLRVQGPMLGYLAALRLARAVVSRRGRHALALDVEAICDAVSAAPERLDEAWAGAALPERDEALVFIALGAASELAENLRFKVLEGLRRPAPPVWDVLQLAHGPWQELADRRTVLVALTHSGVATESRALAEVEGLFAPGRHRLLRLEATLPPPLAIFEHEALVNEWIFRAIEGESLDPTHWEGDAGESGLYRWAPPIGGSGAAPRSMGAAAPGALQHALSDHTWRETETLVRAGARTVVIPLGAFEQHGPHLPLDTDTRIADALAERVCAALPGAVRLPALFTGCSREHLAFSGTLDLRPGTLEAWLVDVLDSLARHGFETLFVFSAHAGNDAALREMLPRLSKAAEPARLIAFTGLARLAEVQAVGSAGHGVAQADCGQHGGEHETSILLGLDPAAVRMGLAEAGLPGPDGDAQHLFHPDLRRNAPNGVVGDPRAASGGRAEAYLTAWTTLLLEAYRTEKNRK